MHPVRPALMIPPALLLFAPQAALYHLHHENRSVHLSQHQACPKVPHVPVQLSAHTPAAFLLQMQTSVLTQPVYIPSTSHINPVSVVVLSYFSSILFLSFPFFMQKQHHPKVS